QRPDGRGHPQRRLCRLTSLAAAPRRHLCLHPGGACAPSGNADLPRDVDRNQRRLGASADRLPRPRKGRANPDPVALRQCRALAADAAGPGGQIGDMMKHAFAVVLSAALSTAAVAAVDPRTIPAQLPPAWQAKTRELFKQAIEIPSVHNRGEVPRVAKLIADQFRAAGIPDADIHFMPYEALPGDQTEALIVRWRSPHATKKPMLILGHMDVVEAKRSDWKYDPFEFREEGGYFLGRGTSDMKNGDVATTMAAVKLMSEGFKPDRDIIFFYSGDEETRGVGATLGSTKWRNL